MHYYMSILIVNYCVAVTTQYSYHCAHITVLSASDWRPEEPEYVNCDHITSIMISRRLDTRQYTL